MRKTSLSVLLILALIIFLSIASGVYAQAAPVVVRINPVTAQVGVGQTIDLAVEVVNVQGMYGFDINLGFNPNAIEVVDADPTLPGLQVSLGTFLDPGFVILNQIDNAAGSLRFAMTQLNPSVAKSGTGNLVVVRFRGKQANALSEIKVNTAQIARIDGTKIPTSPTSGQIQVVQNIPGPTLTSLPTQGAGILMPTNTPGAPISNTPTPRPTAPMASATIKPTSTQPVSAAPTITVNSPKTEASSTPADTLVSPAATSGVKITATLPGRTQSPPTASPLSGGMATATQVLEETSPLDSAQTTTSIPLIGLTGILLVIVAVFIIKELRRAR